ncbi:MAG: hypothetical protein AUH71_06245 [Thaumarchaeota archaeon 13_1_40CM_4_48_7]|nr:MAG: hypothetical protein AUH71_06245 [Thaumarchaeota archaeon 13_1_40CM_4_48_7]
MDVWKISRNILELHIEKLHAGLITSSKGEAYQTVLNPPSGFSCLAAWAPVLPTPLVARAVRFMIYGAWLCLRGASLLRLIPLQNIEFLCWRYFPWLDYTTILMRFFPSVYY